LFDTLLLDFASQTLILVLSYNCWANRAAKTEQIAQQKHSKQASGVECCL